jgi:flavin-dependent dehydrogenase
VLDQIERASFVDKLGAEFISPCGKLITHNIFAEGLVPNMEKTWQVERSRFDKILLDQARAVGVIVHEESELRSIEFTESAVHYQYGKRTGEICDDQASFVIDASGRSQVLGRRLNLPKDVLPYKDKIAVYGHFKNVQRNPGSVGGNIRIVRIQDGWFWNIPISEEITSVGAVVLSEKRKGAGEELFRTAMSSSAFQTKIMEYAELVGDWHHTTDYTYSYTHFAGDRYLMVGDAASFIDPIFSSGVYLAMESGIIASEFWFVHSMKEGQLSSSRQSQYTQKIKRKVLTMRSLIDVFYDDASFSVFMHPTNKWQLAPAVNSLVAGNTELPFFVKVRYWIFLAICKLNKRFPIVPRVYLT